MPTSNVPITNKKSKKKKVSKKKKEIKIKDEDGNILKSEAFMIEGYHPAVGRILEVNGERFMVMDEIMNPHSGTLIKKMTEEHEERIREYDEEVKSLAEKLVHKVDITRMIEEQLKARNPAEIKTGLYILKKEEDGEELEVNHGKGCYEFSMSCGELIFHFTSGASAQDGIDVTGRRE